MKQSIKDMVRVFCLSICGSFSWHRCRSLCFSSLSLDWVVWEAMATGSYLEVYNYDKKIKILKTDLWGLVRPCPSLVVQGAQLFLLWPSFSPGIRSVMKPGGFHLCAEPERHQEGIVLTHSLYPYLYTACFSSSIVNQTAGNISQVQVSFLLIFKPRLAFVS